MANGPGTPAERARRRMRPPKGPIGPEKWNRMSSSQQEKYRQAQTKKGRKSVKKILGMTKRPTAAGQAKFGAVDVTGAQARNELRLARARMNEKLGRAASAGMQTQQLGAQMTEAERRRLGGGR